MSDYKPFKPGKDDRYFINKAVDYRREMIPPAQSNFRVVSIMTYKQIKQIPNTTNTNTITNPKNHLNLSNATFINSPTTQYVIGCNGMSIDSVQPPLSIFFVVHTYIADCGISLRKL